MRFNIFNRIRFSLSDRTTKRTEARVLRPNDNQTTALQTPSVNIICQSALAWQPNDKHGYGKYGKYSFLSRKHCEGSAYF